MAKLPKWPNLQLYDALSTIKVEFDQINSVIHQEEDAIFALENTMKEQVGKNECLTSEFGQLEMASQLAESEATVEMMKKENLIRKIDGMKVEIEHVERELGQKECTFVDLQNFFASKVQEFEDLRERNHAKYLTIPVLKSHIDASDLCISLSETVSQLQIELDTLKVEEQALCAATPAVEDAMDENEQEASVQTIALDTPVPPPSNFGSGMPTIIHELFAQLVEENRLLKTRLERLEMNQAVSIPLEKTAAVTQVESVPIPFSNQGAPTRPECSELNQAAIPSEKPVTGGGATPIPFKKPETVTHLERSEVDQTSIPMEETTDVIGGGGATPIPFQTPIPSQPTRLRKFNFCFKTKTTTPTGTQDEFFGPSPSVTGTPPLSIPGPGEFSFGDSPGGSFF